MADITEQTKPEALSLWGELSRILFYLRTAQVDFRFLCMAVFTSLVLTCLNLYVVSLLFPLVQGIVTADFAHVTQMWMPGTIIRASPRLLGNDTACLGLLVVWVYLCILISGGVGYLSYRASQREARSVSLTMRQVVFDRYLKFGKLYFDRTPITRLVGQMTTCTRWIEDLLVAVQGLFSDSLRLLMFLAVMTFISWKLTLSVVIVLPFLAFVSRNSAVTIKRASSAHTSTQDKFRGNLHQTLALLPLVRMSGQSQRERDQFLHMSRTEFELADRLRRLQGLRKPIEDVSSTTAHLLMGLCLTFLQPPGTLPSGQVFVFFFLTSRVIPVFNSINRFRATIAAQAGPIEQFEKLLEEADKFIVPSGTLPFPHDPEKIRIHNLRFDYGTGKQVLNGVNFSIDRGEHLALIGPTGAGKSTLLHLLMRFYDCPPGAIFVDGTDIRNFNTESLREKIAFVGQDCPIFDDTVRANLLYGAHKEVSEEQLMQCVRAVQLESWLESLPLRLDTLVGEHGAQVSGGERQRIAIGRALLKMTPILILDEPFSSLDAETDAKISDALRVMTQGKIVITVTHRLSGVRRADRIIVLERGSVQTSGGFDELAARPGLVQKMAHQAAVR